MTVTLQQPRIQQKKGWSTGNNYNTLSVFSLKLRRFSFSGHISLKWGKQNRSYCTHMKKLLIVSCRCIRNKVTHSAKSHWQHTTVRVLLAATVCILRRRGKSTHQAHPRINQEPYLQGKKQSTEQICNITVELLLWHRGPAHTTVQPEVSLNTSKRKETAIGCQQTFPTSLY